MIISAYNPKTTELEKTYLSSSVQFDDTALPVKNNEKFVIGDKVLVGEMGGEQSEIRTASAVAASGLQVTVDALDFDHDSDTPIYKLTADKIKFYRRASIAASQRLWLLSALTSIMQTRLLAGTTLPQQLLTSIRLHSITP
jgi:hypothetical protein